MKRAAYFAKVEPDGRYEDTPDLVRAKFYEPTSDGPKLIGVLYCKDVALDWFLEHFPREPRDQFPRGRK